MSPVTLAVLAFLAIVATFGTAALYLSRRQNRSVQVRLAALGDGVLGGRGSTGPISVLADDGPSSGFESFLVSLGRRSTRTADTQDGDEEDQPKIVRTKKSGTAELLVQAGYRRPNAPALFMGLRIALALFLLGIGLLLSAIFNPALMGTAFCLGLIGYVVPGFLLARLATQRRNTIRQTLPDTLDLLLLCVEAGLGLNAALLRVAEERTANGADPIGDEFLQLSKELQVGLTRRDALRNLADRTGSDDVRALSASLIQSERLGSSIAQTLRAQAETIRIQRRLEAEEMANKVQIKLLFPLILFIFPTVMIVILFPAGLRLMAALGNLM